MKSIVKVSSFVFGALMALSLPAMAQEPPPGGEMTPPPSPPPTAATTGGMGAQGQIALAADLPLMGSAPLFSVIRTSNSLNGVTSSSTDVSLAASGDYFVAPNISVGALIGYQDSGQFNITRFAIFVRGGYSLMLTDVLSIWPRIGLGYAHASQDLGGGMSASGSATWLNVEVPVLFHPASHFFIGAGPMLSPQLTASEGAAKRTDLGIMTLIGGYFGG